MKKLLFALTILSISFSYAQVGIGTTTPDANAALEISSTTKVFLPPRMTNAQIQAISNPPIGGMVYCTDCSPADIYVYNGVFFNNLSGTATAGITTVTGAGGATWLDRNLGATQVATSTSDTNAEGWLYQWGRNTDGHQIRTSPLVEGPVVSGTEGSNYIFVDTSVDVAWLTLTDASRWNGATKGIHDPCPLGYRVPTAAEWTTESSAWSSSNITGAFDSPLKLPATNFRDNGSLLAFNAANGYYWSSNASSSDSSLIKITPTNVSIGIISESGQSNGMAVRCIQE